MTEQLYLNEEGLRLCLDGIGEIDNFRGFISEGEYGFYLEGLNERGKYNIETDDIIIIRMSPFDLHPRRYTVNLGDRE